MGNRRHFAVIVLVATGGSGNELAPRSRRRRPPTRWWLRHADRDRSLRGRSAGSRRRRNRPFSPQYPLWTDGASKRRWIYLPAGTAIDATRRLRVELPGRHEVVEGVRVRRPQGGDAVPVEDRRRREWVFASYVWNADGTEPRWRPRRPAAAWRRSRPASRTASRRSPSAVRATSRIARSCWASTRCSCPRIAIRMRFTANRSSPAWRRCGRWSTRVGWRRRGRELVGEPAAHRSAERRRAGACSAISPATAAACHNRRPTWRRSARHWKHGDLQRTATPAPRACWPPHEVAGARACPKARAVLIDPAHPEQSAMLRRMRSRWPASQMPPLGTVVSDREAIDAPGPMARDRPRRAAGRVALIRGPLGASRASSTVCAATIRSRSWPSRGTRANSPRGEFRLPPFSRQDILHHLAVHVGEAEVAALELDR